MTRESDLVANVARLQAENDDLRYRQDRMVAPAPEHEILFAHPHIRFTVQERLLYGYLLNHAGSSLARDSLVAAVSPASRLGIDGPNDKTIDTVVYRIRAKLRLLQAFGVEDVPIIETVWGVGYRARLAKTINKDH